jgi:hypothetical protein
LKIEENIIDIVSRSPRKGIFLKLPIAAIRAFFSQLLNLLQQRLSMIEAVGSAGNFLSQDIKYGLDK